MDKRAFVVKPEEHKPLRIVGENVAVLADAEKTGGVEIFLQFGPEGAGPPPHTHPWDESYYVLEGQVDVLMGDRQITLSAGEFVHLPAGTVHNFRMRSKEAKFLSVTSRPGASRFFADADREVGGALDIPRMMAVCARHEVGVPLPPPQ
jgi:quercetin dioxygenase-like cupin family protein